MLMEFICLYATDVLITGLGWTNKGSVLFHDEAEDNCPVNIASGFPFTVSLISLHLALNIML